MKVDFHCHTHCSDGTLSPAEVIDLALEQQLDAFAITDHDSVQAYTAFPPGNYAYSSETDKYLTLISGCEFTALWSGSVIHIVGLDFDIESKPLTELLENSRLAREERSIRIAAALEKVGVTGALEGAREFALTETSVVGRPHFAKFLVKAGVVSNEKQAFGKFLGSGKLGDVKTEWPSLRRVAEVIAESNGIAIIAHPIHYDFTRTKLLRLIEDFVSYGGRGIEVISGNQPSNQVQQLTDIANQRNMLCSAGSDFHQPGQPWASLGQIMELSGAARPVWTECDSLAVN